MNKSYKAIDLETWSRKEAFLGFLDFQTPQVNVDFDLHVSNAFDICRLKNISFFDFILFHSLKASNQIENFRYRIRDRKPIVHEVVHPDWVVMNEDQSISTKCSEYSDDFNTFCYNKMHYASDLTFGEEECFDHLIFTSCTPWLEFNSITQACSSSQDCIPKLVWGKCNKGLLRFSIQVHHSLVDAWHIAQFKNQMQSNILESLASLS